MGHLERGEKNVSFMSILRVANALNVMLSELFAGLESGESAGIASQRRKRKARGEPGEKDRSRMLQELATMERCVRMLKELARTQEERGKTDAGERKRRGRKLGSKT